MDSPLESAPRRSWSPRYEALNHCRGIAVLAVVAFHGFSTSYASTVHPWIRPLQRLARFGWMGVDLFFVISGYCIAANIYACVQQGRGPLDFIRGRFWRIVPTYWAATLAAIGVALLAMPFNHTSFRQNVPSTGADWIGNLVLLQLLFHRPFYILVCWSLAFEMSFYLSVMALFALSRTLSGRRLFWLLPASAGVVLAAGLDRGTFWPWVEFVFGSLVFYALWQKSQARPRQSAVAIVLLGAGVCAGGWFFMQTQAQQLLFSGLFALMLWAAFPYDEVISSWKGLRWLQQVGIISYSLYLIHIPIQGRFINMAMRATPFNSLRVMAVQIGGWAVAIAASALFYIVVEKPFHARGRIARIP